MPIMRLKEMRDMSSEERTSKLNELKTELLRLRTMIRAGGTVEDPTRIRHLRKTIARIMTIESEQKLGSKRAETKEKPKK